MVLVDVMRGGHGLGNIQPAQADYNQIIHGGGHGDYHPIVLAPASVQESIDLTVLAFDLAEKYRSIAVVLTDGSIGQMMEPAELPPMQPLKTTFPDWAVRGMADGKRHVLSSINLDPPMQERTNIRIEQRWREVKANEVRFKEYFLDDAEFVLVGFGSSGRVALSAVRAARARGIKVGLLRPVSLNPFPEAVLEDLSRRVKGFLVVEMNAGQMLMDVRLATHDRVPVGFFGRMGGIMPLAEEILEEIQRMVADPKHQAENDRERWLERMAEMK